MSLHEIHILPQELGNKSHFFKNCWDSLQFLHFCVLLYSETTFKCEFPWGARRCKDGIDIIYSILKMEMNKLGLVLRTAEGLSVFAIWNSAKLSFFVKKWGKFQNFPAKKTSKVFDFFTKWFCGKHSCLPPRRPGFDSPSFLTF